MQEQLFVRESELEMRLVGEKAFALEVG